jgi:hypothetical protein
MTPAHVQSLAGGVAFYDFGYTLASQSNSWTHVALVRSGGTWKFYAGGVQRGDLTSILYERTRDTT